MKQFAFPGGLEVWNAPEAGGETSVFYREIFERNCYEKHGVRVEDGFTVLDAGANIGLYAISLSRRFRNLRVFCFEPVPATFACLSRNLEVARPGSQIVPLNFGLGANESEVTIEYFPGAPGNSTMYSAEKHRDFPKLLDDIRWTDLWRTKPARALLLLPLFPLRKLLLKPAYAKMLASGSRVQCKIRPLSQVIDEHGLERIDLLKVDVEGAELEVLKGIREEHWPQIRQIAMEVEPANKTRLGATISQLLALGFNRVETESMFGGACRTDDAVACLLYATREPE